MDILEALKNKKMKESELAGAAGVPANRITQCLSGLIELLTPERERVESVLGTIDWAGLSQWKESPNSFLGNAMKRHGCTQSELALAANIGQSRVSLILNDLAEASEHEVRRIEECLGEINWGEGVKTINTNTQKETPLKMPAYPGEKKDNTSDGNSTPTLNIPKGQGNPQKDTEGNQMPQMSFNPKPKE